MLRGSIEIAAEEEAAKQAVHIFFPKQLIFQDCAFIAGKSAPAGKRMGHAGAIISGGKGTAQEKKKTLQKCGIATVDSPADIGSLAKQVFKL